ncbi:MAG: rod shape-determining protein MreC [Frankiaceae bacterium]|nr:rod shape-determining protein MreC [Frankiaceae bacterium]
MRNSRRGRLVLTILLLAAFSLITLDYRTGALNGVRSAGSTIFGPIENGVGHVTHPIGSWFSSIGHLGSYKNENAALKRRISTLEYQANLSAAEAAELKQDRALLHLAGLAQFTVVASRVTAYGSSMGFEETASINRGSASGIKKNMTVISGDGLVGRVITVGHSSSTILLANDPTFSVGIRVEGKQLEIGTVSGSGTNRPLTLELDSNTALLSPGQSVVSLGSSPSVPSPFVPEVPIGTITHVNPLAGGLTETAEVKPFVDYTAIDIVAVVVAAPKSVKHDSLLPASPTPAPTVTVTVTATPSSSSTGSTTTTP